MKTIAGKILLRLSKTLFFFRNTYWRIRLHRLGRDSNIYAYARLHAPRGIDIGDNVTINDFVHIWGAGGVTIGNNTLIAANTTITSQTHDKDAIKSDKLYRETMIFRRVRIGNNVWIGSGAIILPGVTIGDNSIIGAGAIVTKDIPPNSIAIGTPAKAIKTIENS